MSKAFLGAFVVIAAAAVAGVDYVNQSKLSGAAPGKFPVGDYVGTISGRFLSQQAELAAAKERSRLRAMAPRDLLPEAPEGWERRDWDAVVEARLDKRYDMQKDDFLPDELKNDPTLKALSGMDKAARARADAREVFVYAKGDELISLRLRRSNPGQMGGISGLAMQVVHANLNAMSGADGYAMVGGVAFRESSGFMGAEREGKGVRVISGKIGEELTITVRADAGDEAIMALLGSIDYDQINAMLEVPAEGVGNDAPVLDPEASRAMAAAAVKAEDEALRAKGLEAEARLMALSDKIRDDKTGMTALGAALGVIPEAGEEESPADEQAMNEPAAIDHATITPEAIAPSAGGQASSGGMFGRIFGMLSKNGSAATETAPAAPVEVKVNRGGFGNCETVNGVRRCTVGGN